MVDKRSDKPYVPSHPDIIEVVSKSGSFASYAVVRKNYSAGEVLTTLKALTLTPSAPAYSSVQVGPDISDHVQLNSDFLYINHSCRPNLEFHISRGVFHTELSQENHPVSIKIRVAKRHDSNGNTIGLAAGEMLTFFYPSTEWDMAQPFDCDCGYSLCFRTIQGAKYLADEVVFGNDYFFNDHILELNKARNDKIHEKPSIG